MRTRRLPELLALSLLVTLGGSSCSTWVHAPGYAEREQLGRAKLRAARELCSSRGVCAREGSAGVLRVTSMAPPVSSNGLPTACAFRVSYAGRELSCERPGTDGAALSCVQGGAHPLRLDLPPACKPGTLRTEAGTFVVSTDCVEIGGASFAAREVAVHDAAGRLVAFVDFGSYDDDFFGPGAASDRKALLPTLEMTAAALGAYADASGAHHAACDR